MKIHSCTLIMVVAIVFAWQGAAKADLVWNFTFFEATNEVGTGTISFDDPGNGDHLLSSLTNLQGGITIDSTTHSYSTTFPDDALGDGAGYYEFDAVQIGGAGASRTFNWIDLDASGSANGNFGERVNLQANGGGLHLNFGELTTDWNINALPSSSNSWTVSAVPEPSTIWHWCDLPWFPQTTIIQYHLVFNPKPVNQLRWLFVLVIYTRIHRVHR